MMGYALTHDFEHRRRPIAFLLQSNEKEEAYAMLFTDCARYWRSNGWEPELLFFTSDGAAAIRNGLGQVYDLGELTYKNDLWHVEKNVKQYWNRDEGITKEQKE